MKYDYQVVGVGLYGSVFAHEMRRRGKTVLAVDRRKVLWLDKGGGSSSRTTSWAAATGTSDS